LEGALTDALSANIIHTVIVPNFKTGQFSQGILEGTDAILLAIKGEYRPTVGSSKQKDGIPPIVFWPLLGGFLLLHIVGAFRRESGGHRRVRRYGGHVGGPFLGGGGFGGSGGGGGFSGGGGGFGGGGASGGW
jgi:uncharacterized protein